MQQMAKSANSKVIFLPATNQTVQEQIVNHQNSGAGPSSNPMFSSSAAHEYGQGDAGMQAAINSNVVEHM
jgi:erythrocyte band 7 integral membrane protein